MSVNPNLVLDVVLASDETYAKYATVCIQSLIKTNSAYRIRIHLLYNGMHSHSIDIIRKMLNPDYELHTYSLMDIANRIGTSISMDTIPISITAYARLFIMSVLPININKILYIDCDITFNGDIGPFYFSDLGNNLVGGVLDTCTSCRSKNEIGIADNEPYLNSGVLLIALDLWRKENIEKSFIDFIHKMNGKVYHHDQGVINAVCAGRKKIFHPRYNTSSYFFSHPYKMLQKHNTPFYSRQECRDAVCAPIIIHYTSGVVNRPWIENCVHPLKDVFYLYGQMTPYKNFSLQKDNRTFIEKIDSWILRNMPYSIYRFYTIIRKLQYNIRKTTFIKS